MAIDSLYSASPLVGGAFAFVLGLTACSGSDNSVVTSTGGTKSIGGAVNGGSNTVGTGGAVATGTGGTISPRGGSSAGGNSSSATGGSHAIGGTSSTNTGGSTSTGGTGVGGSGTGGTKATGGSFTGGNNTGGNSATGGTSVGGSTTGGAKASGGSNTGGNKATGGAVTTGGTTGIGGSSGGLPALHTEGATIKDPNGKTIILRGVSLPDIGSLWAYNGQSSAGITARVDKITAVGMVPHVIRLPVYPRTCYNTGGPAAYSPAPFPVGTAGGTQVALTADEYVTKVLRPAVDYVTNKGMYVIIDYHQIDNTNGQSATDATTFWTFMAGKFASYTNVLYEPYNEPIDTTTTWAAFKSRAQGWVDTIRASAPNNLIIVPSMNWDQKPGDAASSPLAGSNLVYAAHVYPGNWSTAFKQQVATAVTKAPVFFTEWGYILNNSDATLGTSSATWGSDFRTLVDGNGASWTAWVADNAWTPYLFADNALTTLTDFGTLTKTWLVAKATSDWVQ